MRIRNVLISLVSWIRPNSVRVVAIAFGVLSSAAYATDPISSGTISSMTYRNSYVMFQVKSGATNYCSPCPGDPAGFTAGGFCWIAQTQTAQLTMLLSAKMASLTVTGRVNGISTDCTLYQMTLADN